MSSTKIRFYIGAGRELRRVPVAAIEEKRSYPQLANAGVIRYLQVIWSPDEHRYDIRGELASADDIGVLNFAPDTNLLRMRINAAGDWFSSPDSFTVRRVKQLNAEQRKKYAPSVLERKLVEEDIFGGSRVPFLKPE